MDHSANEIKVGVVVIAGFIILLGFVGAIIGVNWGEDLKEYHTFLRSVPGIVEGSLVKFGGMDVGSITKVTFPEKQEGEAMIELTLKVDKRTPVKTNSRAYLSSLGIMANQHIEISSGTPTAPLLPSGSLLLGREVPTIMQMAEPFGEVAGDLKVLVARLSDLFNDQNRAHLSSVIENVDHLVAEGGGQFLDMSRNMEELTGNMAEVSQSLNELMAKNKGNFDETLIHLEKTTRETSLLISDLRESLVQFENVVAANGASVIEIMENFQFASQNLEEFTRTLKEKPWLLVRKAAPPERKLP